MPVTPNSACVGKTCGMCGGPATHAYGTIWLCCDCHTGEPGGGIYTREQADKIRCGEDPCPDPGPGLRELEAWGKGPLPF